MKKVYFCKKAAMKEKFQQFMISKGLNASRLAEMLGIQPAAISHILSGRNKPSFDLLQKLLKAFPDLNPDWLLLDSDLMYRNSASNGTSIDKTTVVNDGMLFDLHATSHTKQEQSGSSVHEHAVRESNISDQTVEQIISSHSQPASPIERIVVFYADNTFECYSRRK